MAQILFNIPENYRLFLSQSGHKKYKEDVDFVLANSATLTDEKKMLAEFFDDKFNSIFGSAKAYLKVTSQRQQWLNND